jgi:hypothetical protein
MNFSISPQLKSLLLGVGLSTIALEIGLRLLPVKTDHHFNSNNIQNPVLQAQAQKIVEPLDWKFTQAEHRKINNYGFVDDRDYQPGTAPVAVIGDSYVQSSMLPYADTIQGQLSQKLKDQSPVYSYGIPGYSLAGNIGTAEYVSRTFQPRAFVISFTKGDVVDSVFSQGGSYYLNPDLQSLSFQNRDTSELQKLLSYSSLLRYIHSQLKFHPGRILSAKAVANNEVPSTDRLKQKSATLLKYLAEKSGANASNTIFVIDSDREFIYGQKAQPENQEFQVFKQVAESQGYQVIDTQPLFEKHYRCTGRRLDFSPVDAHWNEEGHALIAKEVNSRLQPILAKYDKTQIARQDNLQLAAKTDAVISDRDARPDTAIPKSNRNSRCSKLRRQRNAV